jgi:hypothetical protein
MASCTSAPVDHVRVANNSSKFRVTIALLRALVDVGASDDDEAVVNNADLGMDVHLQTPGQPRSVTKDVLSYLFCG